MNISPLRSEVKSSSLNDLTEQVPSKEKAPQVSRKRKMDPILEALENLREDMSAQFNNIRDQFNSKFDELKLEMAARDTYTDSKLNELTTKIEVMQTENKKNATTIQYLEEQLEATQRMQRMNHIEIRNVPVSSGEDIQQIVKSIGAKIGENINNGDLRNAHRLHTKNKEKMHIIVEFNNTFKKEKFLTSFKKCNLAHPDRKLTVDDIGVPGKTGSLIYMSELLTPKARQLFYQARLLAKSENYKFCWIKRGKVFMKKNEESAAILFSNAEYLGFLDQVAKDSVL